MVDLPVRGPRPDQSIEVPGLELVGVRCEHFEVADSVVARAGPECVVERERGQCRIAAGAAAADREALPIGAAGFGEVQRAGHAVLDVDHTPFAVEPLAIRASVSRAPSIVDVQHRESSARPELGGGIQGVAGRPGRAPVAHDQQRRQLLGRRPARCIARRIVVAVRDLAFLPCGKGEGDGTRQNVVLDRERARRPVHARLPGFEVERHDRGAPIRRTADEGRGRAVDDERVDARPR